MTITVPPNLAARIERIIQKYKDRYDSEEKCREHITFCVIFVGLEGLEAADATPEFPQSREVH